MMTLCLSLTMSSQVRQNNKDLSVNLLLIFLFLVGVRSESTSLADDEESLLANFSLPEELGETLRGLLTDDNFGELSDAALCGIQRRQSRISHPTAASVKYSRYSATHTNSKETSLRKWTETHRDPMDQKNKLIFGFYTLFAFI